VWRDILLIATPILTALAAAGSAWYAIGLKIQRVTDTVTFHKERLDHLDHDVRYAHKRINDMLRRPSRASDEG
jgi:hypothetical protein